jgi:hypothetical protein
MFPHSPSVNFFCISVNVLKSERTACIIISQETHISSPFGMLKNTMHNTDISSTSQRMVTVESLFLDISDATHAYLETNHALRLASGNEASNQAHENQHLCQQQLLQRNTTAYHNLAWKVRHARFLLRAWEVSHTTRRATDRAPTPSKVAEMIAGRFYLNYMPDREKFFLDVDLGFLLSDRAADADKRCAICMEPHDRRTKRLLCGHIMHEACVRTWFEAQGPGVGILREGIKSCPTCRQQYCVGKLPQYMEPLMREEDEGYIMWLSRAGFARSGKTLAVVRLAEQRVDQQIMVAIVDSLQSGSGI